MSERGDFDPAASPEERAEMLRLAERLERERPLAAPAFRGALRRRLFPPRRRPFFAARWRLLAGSYAACGLLLLAIAALGAAGAGPLAA